MDDITDREQLSHSITRAERHLASVVEYASDLVVSVDPRGNILTWNRAAADISGLRAEQVLGRPLPSLCMPEQRADMARVLGALARSETTGRIEVEMSTASGGRVPIAWACSAMRDETGDMLGSVAVGRDLTEQRQLRAQMLQSAKMESLGIMAGGIAHELRNPLGIILAAAELMDEHLEEKVMLQECIRRVHTASKRASAIIEGLLRFARPSGESTRLANVHSLLQEVLAMLHNEITLNKVTVEQAFQAELPDIVCNPDLLRQVFTNLVLNACNAMVGGGVLTISTSRLAGNSIRVTVTDTGKGIADENLEKIFDPFYTTMPVGKGTGLGLSISYSIIQQHRGTLDVRSELGQGTTFEMRLPIKPAG